MDMSMRVFWVLVICAFLGVWYLFGDADDNYQKYIVEKYQMCADLHIADYACRDLPDPVLQSRHAQWRMAK